MSLTLRSFCQQSGAAGVASGSTSVSAPSVDKSKASDNESFLISDLWVRCEAAEWRLKAVEGNLAIALSKQRAAAAREEFLLNELKEAGDKLLCKRSTSPRALLVCCGVFLTLLLCRPPDRLKGGGRASHASSQCLDLWVFAV